jgi:hypothetical protein
MNPLGGPKVGWRALMMFICFVSKFSFMSIFTQIFFEFIFLKTHAVFVSKLIHTTILE